MSAYQRTLAFLAKQLKRDLAAPKTSIVDAAALRADAEHLEATADHLDKAASILHESEDDILRHLEAFAAGHEDGDTAQELPSDRFADAARHLRETAALIRGYAHRLRRKKCRREALTVELFIRARGRYGYPVTLYEAGDAAIDLQTVFMQAGKPISTETAKGYLREVIRMRTAYK